MTTEKNSDHFNKSFNENLLYHWPECFDILHGATSGDNSLFI